MIQIIGMALGLLTGFLAIAISEPLTLKIYNYFGITQPICDGLVGVGAASCQAISALFEVSLFILGIFGVICIALVMNLFMRKLIESGMKEKCIYCNKELGKDYQEDKSKWKEDRGDEQDHWTHSYCIPRKDKRLWNAIQ